MTVIAFPDLGSRSGLLGQEVHEGDELARVYLRREDEGLATLFAGCFTVADEGTAPRLIPKRIF